MWRLVRLGALVLGVPVAAAVLPHAAQDWAFGQVKTTAEKTVQAVAPAATPATPAAEKPKDAATSKAKTKPKAKPKKPQGRLPKFYDHIVSDEQRQKIYAIQQEYGPKIDALKAQLAELVKQQDEKIGAVLTPEQQKKVQELREAAKAKAADKGDSKGPRPLPEKKPETSAPTR
jgi:Spy/CpxP family protein refolding chaperone